MTTLLIETLRQDFLAVASRDCAPHAEFDVVANRADGAVHHRDIPRAGDMAASGDGREGRLGTHGTRADALAFGLVRPVHVVIDPAGGATDDLVRTEEGREADVLRAAVDPLGMAVDRRERA